MSLDSVVLAGLTTMVCPPSSPEEAEMLAVGAILRLLAFGPGMEEDALLRFSSSSSSSAPLTARAPASADDGGWAASASAVTSEAEAESVCAAEDEEVAAVGGNHMTPAAPVIGAVLEVAADVVARARPLALFFVALGMSLLSVAALGGGGHLVLEDAPENAPDVPPDPDSKAQT